jgi:hypothetical protein
MIYLLNFFIAEIAAFLTYQHFLASPLRYFLPYPAELLIFAIPVVGLIIKRPFSFPYYVLLLFFNISPVLSGSETFEGVVDSLNAIDVLFGTGTSNIAESLAASFINYSGSFDSLLEVTWLYVLAEVFHGNWESMRRARELGVEVEAGYLSYIPAFAFTILLLVVYPEIVSLHADFELDRIVAAVLGIAAFLAGAYLLSRSVEEEDINSGG